MIPIGTRLKFVDDIGMVILGEVINRIEMPARKIVMPKDVCVRWETGLKTTYDESVILESFEILS